MIYHPEKNYTRVFRQDKEPALGSSRRHLAHPRSHLKRHLRGLSRLQPRPGSPQEEAKCVQDLDQSWQKDFRGVTLSIRLYWVHKDSELRAHTEGPLDPIVHLGPLQNTSIKGLMVSITRYLGFLKGQLGSAGRGP